MVWGEDKMNRVGFIISGIIFIISFALLNLIRNGFRYIFAIIGFIGLFACLYFAHQQKVKE